MLMAHLFHHNMLPLILICLGLCLPASATAEDSIETELNSVSFTNDVVPLLTKAGCNSGVCHAKAGGGQNGFQLSLLGFEPREDFEAMVIESRGRRLFRSAPEQSLLLLKASGQTPHGGGKRIAIESDEFRVFKSWIDQGAKFTVEDEPTLVSIAVEPERGTVSMNGTQSLKTIATFSNGTMRDVTAVALYESNHDAMADVDESGLVTISDLPGKVAIMVRYQDKSAVFTAAVPVGPPLESVPPSNNFIDDHLFANLKEIGISPSAVCDDATFLRRVSLDIAGRLPTLEESRTFLSDDTPEKRNNAIERLLKSPGYADFFANKWTSLLKNRRDDASDITSNFAFHAWMRDSLLANVPYDQIVRELLAATGTVIGNPPVAWYKRVKDPKQQIEDVAQLFLGVRMQCAQCHHHPFERWSQDDYYALSAFFSQIGRKPTGTRGEDMIFHKRGIAQAKNVKTEVMLKPAALGDDVGEIGPDDDPRLRLADWMASPENPFFAKAVVNRYWKHFFKVGLIEPEDDIRDTNPPTNPELLAALEKHFIESGFDLKELVSVITQSRAYQLQSAVNETNLVDHQNYSRFYPRRLEAEVLLDAVDDLTGSPTTFSNLPPGTRAVALPDNSYNKQSAFLRVFGRPNGESVCGCERVQASSLAQSLHLINSNEIKGKLATGKGTAATLFADKRPLDEKIEELYLTAFSRLPTSDEMSTVQEYFDAPLLDADGKPIAEATVTKQKIQDVIWALMNSKEFLFNH